MTPTEERMQRFLELITLERMHAAWSDGAIVGGAAAFSFNVTVPGGDLPTAGVSVVGVYPTHRRRGVLRALMRAQLDDAHERGEPLAALWASEESIYGRFGYGLAAFCGEISLAHEYTSFAHPSDPVGTLRFLEPEEALEALPPVFERIRLQWPGMFSRSRLWWEQRETSDPEERRDGAGPKRWIAYERDGSIEGYAVYRHKPGWEQGSSVGELRVLEALGATRRRCGTSGPTCSPSTGRRPLPPRSCRPTIHCSCCSPRRGACATAWATHCGCGSSTSGERCPADATSMMARSCSMSWTTSARGTRAAGSSRTERRGAPTRRPTCGCRCSRSAAPCSAASRFRRSPAPGASSS
jgi:GNAT superfamily N-acetyltransferase